MHFSQSAASTYDHAWRELRRRERLCFVIALVFVPCAMAIMTSWSLLDRDVPSHFGLWLGGGWLAAFVAAELHRARFRCPRCGDVFFARIIGHGVEHQRCTHCELPRGFASRHSEP